MIRLEVKKLRRSMESYTMLNHNGFFIFVVIVVAVTQRAAPALS
jgi:hypothetical protein